MEKLGKYEIQSTLGEGAMGKVYKAWDPFLKRQVALKTITGDFKTNPELLKRFYREAQSAGGLAHFNIVTIYDLGETDGTPYIAMEFLEGSDLQSFIYHNRIQTLNDALKILKQVGEGLSFAHSRGIVHRDVKPANIFILKDGTVKIVDFGIAMVGASTMTRTGMVMGTVSYMSPEQVQGKNLDGRSDQFSVGIILYEMLTRRKPFTGESIPEIFFKLINGEPDPISQFYPHCPPALEAVCRRCLQKDREKRYADLGIMAKDVETLLYSLKRPYTFQEEIRLEGGTTSVLSQAAMDEIRGLADSGDFNQANALLHNLFLRYSGKDPLVDENLNALRSYVQSRSIAPAIRKRLENAESLARSGKFDLAENMLAQLEKEYPEAPEIGVSRKSIQELKRNNDKLDFIRSQIAMSKVYLDAGNFPKAMQTMEKALQSYPEESSLLGFYKRILAQKDEAEKKDFIRTACMEVSQILKEGHLEPAMRRMEQALERFPSEEILQNLYRNLVNMKKQVQRRF